MSGPPISSDYWEHPEVVTLAVNNATAQTYTPPAGKTIIGIQSTGPPSGSATTRVWAANTSPNTAPFGTVTSSSGATYGLLNPAAGIIRGEWTQISWSSNGTGSLTTLLIYLTDAS